jgi:hypothetical protein
MSHQAVHAVQETMMHCGGVYLSVNVETTQLWLPVPSRMGSASVGLSSMEL